MTTQREKAVATVAVVTLLGGILLLGKKAGASTCFEAQSGQYYYATYQGSTKLMPLAFGDDAWSKLYSVEAYFSEYGEWDSITSDPENYVLAHGQYLRFRLSQDAQICGFQQEVPG